MSRLLDEWIARRAGLPLLDSKTLAVWQLRALARTVAFARRASVLYRERLAGLPEDFPKRQEDVACIPFLTADDLRFHAEAMLCVSRDDVARVVSLRTSGTTGGPKRVFLTPDDLAATLEFFREGMRLLAAPGDTSLILLPGRAPDGAADLLARATVAMGCRAVLAPEGCPPDEAARLALAENASCLAALPMQMRALLAVPQAMGLLRGRVRTVLLSGEPVARELRTAIEQTLGCEVFVHYGLTETGFGAGVECRAHQGYHLREADLFVEIVDPGSGCPLSEGEPGEIVVSTLSRIGMPLIRYRTGDLGSLLPGPCACGSPLWRLGAVAGRIVQTAAGMAVTQPEKGALKRARPSFDPERLA